MIYSSLLFIYIFLPVSVVFYYFMPRKFSETVLLILSIVFCALSGGYFLILFSACTVLNYVLGILSGGKGKARIIFTVIGIILNMATMFLIRTQIPDTLIKVTGIPKNFFPLGISFLSLSASGYLIDVYRKKTEPEKNMILFGLYMMFFPVIVFRPLMRYDKFRKAVLKRKYNISFVGKGLIIFVKGLSKKVICADNLYMLYTDVKSIGTENLSVINAWIGCISYIFCLYFTFSGLSDMCRGTAMCFGIKLQKDFNYPMFSSRIRYFSAKWHVTAVRWFRHHLTKPLALCTSHVWLRNIVFIFAWGLFGFWYGLNAGSALWGILMGISMVIEHYIRNRKMLKATGVLYTSVFILIFSVFLSSDNVPMALQYLFAMAGGNRILADSVTIYFMKCYLVAMIVIMYASTDLFRNMLNSSVRVQRIVSAVTPFVTLALLIVCTAFISDSGVSDIMIMRL